MKVSFWTDKPAQQLKCNQLGAKKKNLKKRIIKGKVFSDFPKLVTGQMEIMKCNKSGERRSITVNVMFRCRLLAGMK